MRSLILILSGLIAACSPQAHQPSTRSTTPQPEPTIQLDSRPHSTLVNSIKKVGPRDFANSKKVLPKVFDGLEEDFYCGCRYVSTVVDFGSCGYKPRKNPLRAGRIEWEHVVPAWVLGHQRQCWQNGGRKNCTDTDPVFQQAEGDLNNLVPAVGEVNGDRNNFAYSAWTRERSNMYGECQTIIDFKGKRVQPREEVRGRAARITLYMYERYDLQLSAQDKKLMCAWAKTYPVDAWERERDARIVRWQGAGNPLVEHSELLASVCR